MAPIFEHVKRAADSSKERLGLKFATIFEFHPQL
jgi:hypothetical protein